MFYFVIDKISNFVNFVNTFSLVKMSAQKIKGKNLLTHNNYQSDAFFANVSYVLL